MKKLFLVLGLAMLLASCCNNNQSQKCNGKAEQKCEQKCDGHNHDKACQGHSHEACEKKCEGQKPECCKEQQACEKQCEKILYLIFCVLYPYLLPK